MIAESGAWCNGYASEGSDLVTDLDLYLSPTRLARLLMKLFSIFDLPAYIIQIPKNNDGMQLFYCLSLILLACTDLVCTSPEYAERLLLQPLPQSSLLASFNFRSNASLTSFEKQHFRYFPRSLGQILQHAQTRELHLRFSTGRWDAESSGTRPWGGAKEGGTGVELWAWVEAETEQKSVEKTIEPKLCRSELIVKQGFCKVDHT